MAYRIRQVEPNIGRLERKYVNDCLKRKWITEGKYAELFLEKIRDITGCNYAVLAPNGTLALYMALHAMGIKRGDKVLVPDVTFNATASILPFLGATPVFCDIDPRTMQMDVTQVEAEVKTHGIKIIIPVHLYGQTVDMKPLLYIAGRHNIMILEDAAQGIGVKYKMEQWHHVGTMGKAGIFAFYADKNFIMGEGGVVVTNDEKTYFNLKYLRNQGRLQSGSFEHERLGMNFRITDMQCAVGYAQLQRYIEIAIEKSIVYSWYVKYMPRSVRMMDINPDCIHVPLRCPVFVDDKKKVMAHLEKNGIQTRLIEYPLHRQPCWKHLRYESDAFPGANEAFEHGLLLPMHTKLSEKDVRYVCRTIQEAVE